MTDEASGAGSNGDERALADPDAPVDFTPGELSEPVDSDDDGHEVDG